MGVGVFEQMAGDLTGAASHVENLAATAEIELPLSEHPLAERLMQRQHAARGENRPLRPGIDVADFGAVFVVADALDQLVFQQMVDDALAAAARRFRFLR